MRIFLLLISLWVLPMMVWANSGGEEKKKEGEEGAVSSEPMMEYIEMKPKFTVNLAEPKKYLLLNIQLMVEGEKPIEKVKKNMPAIRNALIMLYSGLAGADVQSMEQREALRIKTKDEIRAILEKFSNSDGFRDVFFTEFFVN
ncbi:MAG: flagellar basal body-associated FliL family protein [Methylococcales bacterium]|nr:flagellar basal body-associated FliL family protein [Methylococcales bacterium]